MKRKLVLLSIALALVLVASTLAAAQSGGDYDLEWQAMGSAGDEFPAGGDYQLGFTLAQVHDTPISAGGDYQIALGYWAGEDSDPTAVIVVSFTATAQNGVIVLAWETASEIDILGFHLYRSESGKPGTYVQLNEGLIPSQAPGSPVGAHYEWVDDSAVPGQSYLYLLEAVDIYGQVTQYGPVPGLPAGTRYRVYLPLVYGRR